MTSILRILFFFLTLCMAFGSSLAKPSGTTADSRAALPDSIAMARADSIREARADSILRALPPEFAVSAKEMYIPDEEVEAEEFTTAGDSLSILGSDTIPVIAPFNKFANYNEWEERDVLYNPDPTRAVWMSALFPGLGQVYNRRYWKLPIIVGGYLGLAYATSWNNTMLTDYTKAYRDITDSDPTTNSYMNFFPPTVTEDSLDKTWLTSLLKSKRDYFRRNRDLCIICMVGVYFLAMIDAYVDASLSHFDISPDLSMDVIPSVIMDGRNKLPSVGMTWALNF